MSFSLCEGSLTQAAGTFSGSAAAAASPSAGRAWPRRRLLGWLCSLARSPLCSPAPLTHLGRPRPAAQLPRTSRARLSAPHRLRSRGARHNPSVPLRCLSRQQVRPDYWGVCWRLHPDAADPNTPASLEC